MSNAPLIYVDLLYVTARRYPGGKRPQPWRWIAKNGDNNKIIARSSERYTNKQDCIDAIQLLFGPTANVYLREKEHGNQMLRLETQFDADAVNDAADAAETPDDDPTVA